MIENCLVSCGVTAVVTTDVVWNFVVDISNPANISAVICQSLQETFVKPISN